MSKKRKYRSGLEDRLAAELRGAGCKYRYEAKTYTVHTEVGKNSVNCADCGSKNLVQKRRYTPDFFLENGIVIEAKGRFTADNRRLIARFVEQHPDVDLRMVFSRDNRLTKTSKTWYSDWCKSKGIPYAIGGIPEQWAKKT